MKKILLGGIILGLAAIAADYTVPKTWTRTGAEYAKAATLVFDPLSTNTPVRVQVRVKQVFGDDRVDIWTPEGVAALPNNVTNSINGAVTTNIFKVNMLLVFQRANLVTAYNWSLVDGREESMVPR
jgi:hypothetical protein